MDTTDILNSIEKEKIAMFVEDKVMFEAVKKFILDCLYRQGVIRKDMPHNPEINWAVQLVSTAINPSGMPRTDAELGADLRAKAMGLQIVLSGFKELSELKKGDSPKELEENHI